MVIPMPQMALELSDNLDPTKDQYLEQGENKIHLVNFWQNQYIGHCQE